MTSATSSRTSCRQNPVGLRTAQRRARAKVVEPGPGGSCRAHQSKTPCSASSGMSVFGTSRAMVIGPTPPGTGVMYDALRDAESKSTSPFVVPRSLRRSRSTGFDPLASDQSGETSAATRSADSTGGSDPQCVSDSRLPSRHEPAEAFPSVCRGSGRPITTACRPLVQWRTSRAIPGFPPGVQDEARGPMAHGREQSRVTPSTSFAGSMASNAARSSTPGGTGCVQKNPIYIGIFRQRPNFRGIGAQPRVEMHSARFDTDLGAGRGFHTM